MRTAVADTSIEAYRKWSVRDLSEAHWRLLRAIRPGRDFSRAELAMATGMKLQTVCGRINELVAARRLEHGPQRKCAVSGNTVNPVRHPQPEQLSLF